MVGALRNPEPRLRMKEQGQRKRDVVESLSLGEDAQSSCGRRWKQIDVSSSKLSRSLPPFPFETSFL